MASALTVEAHRKRFSVKATPMMPLSAVVSEVLGQLKLEDVPPSACTLILKGKPLDQTLPVRFANIGKEKLELKTGREPVLGVHTAPASSPAGAAPSQPQAQPQPQPVPAAVPALAASHPEFASSVPVQAASQPPPPAPAPAPAAALAQPAASGPAPSTSTAAPAPAAANSGPSGAADDSHPSVALFGRRVYVFTRQAEQQAEQQSGGGGAGAAAELDDSFYEFTEMDLRRAMSSQAAQRAKQEGGHLMTAQMREREERRRAESYGSVPIRLYLPDGTTCLQTLLPATEQLSAVLALARAALVPGAAAGAYLFTTPPRVVVKEKDLGQSLYAAKMVPAAKVHVGIDASKAATAGAATATSVVRPEVLALAEQPPERAAVMHTGQAQQQPATASAAGVAAGSGSRSAVPAGGAGGGASRPGGAPVPKWLKLNK